MKIDQSVRNLVLLWLAWAAIILGFQALVTNRLDIRRPDYAVEWSAQETAFNSQNGKPYLIEPFMNGQVSWDSEFYLSIATVGYDDPDVRRVDIPIPGQAPLSMNYAFYPFYPLVMRVVAAPLRLFGLTPIATSTLAGVIVALLGTLAGVLALADLTRDELGEAGGWRTAFYFLIFPSAFFLAQVYTEGLFAGLAFGCLALLHRRKLAWAAVLACLATWTRAVGIVLIVPLFITWAQETELGSVYLEGVPTRKWVRGLWVLAPIGAYLIWHQVLGAQLGLVDEYWFGRGVLDLDKVFVGWQRAWEAIFMGDNPQMRVYFLLELGSVLAAAAACVATLRRYPALSLFSAGVLFISLTSGSPQSLIRYVLGVPALYIALGRLGKHAVFDRAWSLASILLLGMQAMLFTFDMWVA